MRIAVVGGTGVVGRHVVEAASLAGHDTIVLARSTGVDVTTGAGVDEALAGAQALIDVSNVATLSRRRSVRFFRTATERLLAAGERAGVRHHVVLSIVGVDRVDLGYYEGKRVQEQLVLSGPVPSTVLRATQFHEFAGQLLDRSPGPLVVAPRMRSQPVAAREAALALVELADGPAVGRAPELAGPEVLEMVDLVRRTQRARRRRAAVLSVRLPGAAGRAMAGGGLLPPGAGPRGEQRFDQWLAEQG